MVFKNDRQRKCVLAKLSKLPVGTKLIVDTKTSDKHINVIWFGAGGTKFIDTISEKDFDNFKGRVSQIGGTIKQIKR